LLKQTIAGQLDLIRYLERGSVHLAISMSAPQEAACEPEADEQWRTGSGIVYTLDFDGWSVNLSTAEQNPATRRRKSRPRFARA